MLRIDDRSTNYTGVILINNDQIAYIYGNHNENSGSINISVEDYDAFQQNLATIKADIAAFVTDFAEASLD